MPFSSLCESEHMLACYMIQITTLTCTVRFHAQLGGSNLNRLNIETWIALTSEVTFCILILIKISVSSSRENLIKTRKICIYNERKFMFASQKYWQSPWNDSEVLNFVGLRFSRHGRLQIEVQSCLCWTRDVVSCQETQTIDWEAAGQLHQLLNETPCH